MVSYTQTGDVRSRAAILSIMAAATLLAPAVVSAQSPQGTKVALVDISMIFQKNQRFSATMDAMKTEVDAFEASVKQRGEALKAKSEGLKRFAVGSPEYRRDEAGLAKESAELQVDIGLKRKEIMDREARVFFEAYQEVVQHVEAIARSQNIGIVLRYNSAQIDPNERNSVQAGVNRSIVYQNQLDITDLVLNSINRRAAPTGAQPTARQQVPRTNR
ncbi:MAG: OmpH family outer membrane protein [Planctomycetales bacterium]|nr:OmpH family outer membrane protein [Planctomycetales bacterium]